MAPLTDERLLALFLDALGNWQYAGYVVWKRVAAEWVLRNLFESHTSKSLAKLMFDHVESGGIIDQIRESRLEFTDRFEFHFDFRIRVDERIIYIETTLDTTRTGPVVTIVSIHDA